MSDVTPIPKRERNNPVKIIDTHEQIVRDYLKSLDEPPTAPRSVDPQAVIRGIEDPIARLKALAEAKRRSNVNELEEQFVDVAARWANKNDIGREAFAALGVPSSVLRRAFGGTKSKDRQGTRTRISIDTLKAGIASKPKGARLTVASITDEIGGSAATVRKVLNELTQEGVVKNEGPDKEYSGRGRAPVVFRRT